MGAAAPKSDYVNPLLTYARIPSDKYEDPYAKRTLDLLRRWALGMETLTLPQIEDEIIKIYPTKVPFGRWKEIMKSVNDSEEVVKEKALNLIEKEYKGLVFLPEHAPSPSPPSPAPTFSRPPTPPGTALPVSPRLPGMTLPSAPQEKKSCLRTVQEILANPRYLTHRKGGYERTYPSLNCSYK